MVDKNWPINKYGQDMNLAIPASTQVVGGNRVLQKSLMFQPAEDSTNGFITVLDFGGIMNVNTAAQRTINAQAILAMAAAVNMVIIPEGTLWIDPTVVPNTVTLFIGLAGSASIVSIVSTPNFTTLSFSSPILIVKNLRITAPFDASGGSSAFLVTGCTQGQIENVSAEGNFAVVLTGCSNIDIINMSIDSWSVFGLLVIGSSNNIRIFGGTVKPSIAMAGAHGITFQGVTNCGVYGAFIDTPADFGVNANSSSRNITVLGCRIIARFAEAINFDNSSGIIANNDCTAPVGHSDFLISIFAHDGGNCDNTSVIGNTVTNSGACGIAIAQANYISVRSNRVINPCQDIASGGINRDAGIIVYADSQHNIVDGNHITDTSGKMVWAVAEEVVGGGGGTPNNNTLGINFGDSGTSGFNTLTGANSFCYDPIFINYVPVISSTGGAFGSYVIEEAAYGRRGPVTEIIVRFQVTDVGAAGGILTIALPNPSRIFAVIPGTESALTGSMLQASISPGGTVMGILTYNNVFPGATGARITMCGTY